MNKREAILSATLNLLANKGFHGFSIKQVADQAGVAAGTVYLYFTDREDLIQQLQTGIVKTVGEHIFADHDVQQPLFFQYQQFCQSFWQLFMQQPNILLSKAQFDHLPPEVITAKNETIKQALNPLMAFLERGRQEGVMKNLPDEVLLSLGFEPYFSLARKQLLGLINIDANTLGQIIEANWDAITIRVTSSSV